MMHRRFCYSLLSLETQGGRLMPVPQAFLARAYLLAEKVLDRQSADVLVPQ